MESIRDRVKELRRVRAGDLVPNSANWRLHPQRQRDALAGVLGDIGYADAILVRELPDGRLGIVDGHCRAEVTPDAIVPVLVLDVNEQEAKVVLATLDPLAGMAETDGAALTALLSEIETTSPSVQTLLDSINADAMEALVSGKDSEPAETSAAPEPTEDLLAKWQVKPGQLWTAGRHRILCGDSTNPDDVARLLDGDKPTVCATDPPYGINYSGGRTQVVAHKTYGRIAGDKGKDISRFIEPLLEMGFRDLWVCCSPVNLAPALRPFDAVGGVNAIIVWDKRRPGLGYQWIRRQCEFILYKTTREKPKDEDSEFDLWSIATDAPSDYQHGTQKPVALMERALQFSGAGMVYEPYGGSGSTLLACQRLGRVCRAIELEPGFVAVCLERLQLEGLDPKPS